MTYSSFIYLEFTKLKRFQLRSSHSFRSIIRCSARSEAILSLLALFAMTPPQLVKFHFTHKIQIMMTIVLDLHTDAI